MLNENFLLQIDKTLSTLTLGHAWMPGSQWSSYWVVLGDEHAAVPPESFLVTTPQSAGLSREALQTLFNADQAFGAAPLFEHPAFQEPVLQAVCPALYDDKLLLAPFFEADNFTGRVLSPDAASYYLVACGAAGPVALLEFSLALAPLASHGASGLEELAPLGVHVTLERFYTLKAYRGRGAATALCRTVRDIVEAELTHIAQALDGLSQASNVVFDVEPWLTASVSSKTGWLAYCNIREQLNELFYLINEYPDVLEPAFDSLTVAPINESLRTI